MGKALHRLLSLAGYGCSMRCIYLSDVHLGVMPVFIEVIAFTDDPFAASFLIVASILPGGLKGAFQPYCKSSILPIFRIIGGVSNSLFKTNLKGADP